LESLLFLGLFLWILQGVIKHVQFFPKELGFEPIDDLQVLFLEPLDFLCDKFLVVQPLHVLPVQKDKFVVSSDVLGNVFFVEGKNYFLGVDLLRVERSKVIVHELGLVRFLVEQV